MKKLVFTALAIVAFSAVAMANNVDVEKRNLVEDVLTIEKIKIEQTIIGEGEGSCEMAAIILIEASPICEFLDDVGFYEVYRFLVETCETINP